MPVPPLNPSRLPGERGSVMGFLTVRSWLPGVVLVGCTCCPVPGGWKGVGASERIDGALPGPGRIGPGLTGGGTWGRPGDVPGVCPGVLGGVPGVGLGVLGGVPGVGLGVLGGVLGVGLGVFGGVSGVGPGLGGDVSPSEPFPSLSVVCTTRLFSSFGFSYT